LTRQTYFLGTAISTQEKDVLVDEPNVHRRSH
jgi:hypothetical protein